MVSRIKMVLTEMVRLSLIRRERMNLVVGMWNLRIKVGWFIGKIQHVKHQSLPLIKQNLNPNLLVFCVFFFFKFRDIIHESELFCFVLFCFAVFLKLRPWRGFLLLFYFLEYCICPSKLQMRKSKDESQHFSLTWRYGMLPSPSLKPWHLPTPFGGEQKVGTFLLPLYPSNYHKRPLHFFWNNI